MATGNPNLGGYGDCSSHSHNLCKDHGSPFAFSPLRIALIGICASAFILVCYYIFIYKYCHRRRENSASATSTNPNQAVGNEALINSIAVYRYRNMDGLVEASDCSVCLSEFQEDESLRLLPGCNHAFHVLCIDPWFQSHSNCPLCRALIVGVNVPSAVEIVAV